MRIARRAGLVGLVVALFGLTACHSAPPSPPPSPLAPPTHNAGAPLKRRRLAHALRPHGKAAIQTPRPAVAAGPPAAAAQPERVIGWTPDQVRARLGPAAEEEIHGPVRVWTYRAGGCGLRITFYYDVTRGGFFALSQRLTGSSDDKASCAGWGQDTHAS